MNLHLTELNLYNLMADDCNVWLNKNEKFGFTLELEYDDGSTFIDNNLHPCAAESLADFCKRFLRLYGRAIGGIAV